MNLRDQRQNARLEALERRMATVLEHLGLEDPVPAVPDGVSARVAELARAGRAAEAIRAHMKETGVNLAAACDAVASVTP